LKKTGDEISFPPRKGENASSSRKEKKPAALFLKEPEVVLSLKKKIPKRKKGGADFPPSRKRETERAFDRV